jgi:putative transposase
MKSIEGVIHVPRRPRLILPDMPHHIVHRGHNRRAVFIEQKDYQYYLDNLIEWKETLQIQIYSYCLMTNHVHIIADPGEYPSNIGEFMKRLAAKQTRYVNKLERRTGSLWDSRYKISPIDTDEYLLQCSRYVELNPVTACMCEQPEQYKWSSYRAKLGLTEACWLYYDTCFKSLGTTIRNRRKGYASFVRNRSAANKAHEFIQTAVSRNQLTGSNRFVDDIESRIGIRVEYRGRGRPVKNSDK